MTDTVIVTEVGLRDGLQNQRAFLNTGEKIRLVNALLAANIRNLEVTSFVSPKAVPQMADAEALVASLPAVDGVSFSALVPNNTGYARALASGVRSIAVVLAATDTLNRKNINLSLNEARSVCESVIRRGKSDGVAVRAYIAAACSCPFEGRTPLQTVVGLSEQMVEAGADEIALADTIGAGSPAQIEELFETAIRRLGVGRVAAHFHDTRGMGLALVWAALKAGVRRFDSSIGGLGGCPFAPGASGNLATEDLVFMLNETGFHTGIDFGGVMRAVDEAQALLGAEVGGKIVPWYRTSIAGSTAPAAC